MGKRELLLIGCFMIVGVAVYFATAPDAAPGQQGFSVSKLIEHIRRDVRGNPASAEVTSSSVRPIAPAVTEIRFELIKGAPLTIVGEDRTDVAFDLGVKSSGYTEAEARKYASETTLSLVEAGNSLIVSIAYPTPAEQWATLAVRVPRRLGVRVQPTRGKLEISDVSAVELVEARGPVTLKRIAGRLVVTHRGGTLTIEGTNALKLNARGSTIVLNDIRGEILGQVQSGELRATRLSGPVELESSNAKIDIDDAGAPRRPIRLTAIGGTIAAAGVAADLRVEARDARVEVAIAKPATVTINTEGGERMQVTLPARGGLTLDALAMHSRLTLPDGLLEITTTEAHQRATGAIDGGGPTVTLRATRGDITVKRTP
jgi:hypothetical protein